MPTPTASAVSGCWGSPIDVDAELRRLSAAFAAVGERAALFVLYGADHGNKPGGHATDSGSVPRGTLGERRPHGRGCATMRHRGSANAPQPPVIRPRPA